MHQPIDNPRDELILEFMKALATNSACIYGSEATNDKQVHKNSMFVLRQAESLADVYINIRLLERN
jgi:hypothetical protein